MGTNTGNRVHTNVLNTTLLVVGLGYSIDCFDLFLYNAVRMPSLHELGLDGDALTKAGIAILNLQILGMLLGSLLWGVMGDKIGRKKALIGSVLVYSIGSLGCAFVHDVTLYAVLRFLTGVGLAGELALGAVLVAETVPDHKRDWGIALYAIFAYLGIISASLLAGYLPWRTCYAVGGVTGLLLLLGRVILFESGLYEAVVRTKTPRGSLTMLWKKRDLLKRWLCCIFFVMPYYFVPNVLITLAPEFGKSMGALEPIKGNIALLCWSLCAAVGTILGTIISHNWQKRVLPLSLFMIANAIVVAFYLNQSQPSALHFYVFCGLAGAANFYVLILFAAVEQFGTNMRATASASALNAGRGTLVITNSIFLAFRAAGFDIITSAAYVAAIVFAVGFVCLLGLRETYHQGMDFLEESA